MPPLAFGLYERLITRALRAELDALEREGAAVARVAPLDPAEAHARLARHVERIVAPALRDLHDSDRSARQANVANRIVALLAVDPETRGGASDEEAVAHPPQELHALRPVTGDPARHHDVERPIGPMSAADLLVNARGEPALAHALAREIPSADGIDLLCAFVRWHGLRLLMEPLAAHCRDGKPLRVITTVYTGSTERKALDWLVGLGAQVRVSYDTQSTRLHAKAWMFRRETGYSTAYIGSSNLSKSALLDGVEWNVRLSEVGSPDVLEKFDATFEGYWSSREYEDYAATPEQAARFDRAIASDCDSPLDAPLTLLDVEPWPHQREILEKLDVERKRRHRWKNLVVAATGTGKTIAAALDYKRLCAEGTFGPSPRLLFVAHRQEILKQSLGAFRQVLRNGQFGELYVAGDVPEHWQHVFGAVQSLSQMDLDRLAPTSFDLQQRGRGLRRHEGKDCVTVLDFIGQAHRQSRFDLRYRAVTGATRTEVEKQIQQGFPLLPAGCSIQLDRVATTIVLKNIKSAIPSRRPAMLRELRALMESDRFEGRVPTLRQFLEETGLELGDLYKAGCWSDLKRAAGVPMPPPGPYESQIGHAVNRLLHLEDPLRVAEHLTYPLDDEAGWTHRIPLSVHARHTLREVLTAFGMLTVGGSTFEQKGVFRDERTNTDLFFVTLEKSERDYSPSTLYKDYAISPVLFHWESQSGTTQESPTGRRYIRHRDLGGHILLFVRPRRRQDGRALPYTLLGPADIVSFKGERPISFVWRLRRPMPAGMFREARVATG